MTTGPQDPVEVRPRMEPTGGVWCDQHGRYECTKGSKQSGERCHKPRIMGTASCDMHSGLSVEVARARGEANLLLAGAGAREGQPRTHPAVVLLDACQLAYDLMQHASTEPVESMGPEQWDRVTKSLDQAARIAKAALDADAQDRHVRALERRAGDQASGVEEFLRVFVAELGLGWEDEEVRGALVRALEAGETA